MIGTIQRLASLCKFRRGFTGRCLNIRKPVSEILFETFEGVDSSNISFIKKHDVSYSCHSFCFTQWILLSTINQQRPGCQQYGNQRFHNSMDLQPMTTSYCRHSPSLSREENVLHAFHLVELLHSFLSLHMQPQQTLLRSILSFVQSDRTSNRLPVKICWSDLSVSYNDRCTLYSEVLKPYRVTPSKTEDRPKVCYTG